MKILNLIWGFALGAGIDKCYITYSKLGDIDPELDMLNVCIRIGTIRGADYSPLEKMGAKIIDIQNKRDFSWYRKLNTLIAQERPDRIFAHGFGSKFVLTVLWIRRKLKVPVILSDHGLYHAPTASKKLIEPIVNYYHHRILYRFLADKVICVSEQSRNMLLSKGLDATKIRVVHNGLQQIERPPKADIPRQYKEVVKIVTASRITPEKGLPYLLEALKKLKSQGMKFHYFMIGDGPDLPQLKQKAALLGLDGEISFLGFRSNIPAWLETCDIFALPSLHENHSIAILEAMRAGKAIVATRVGGNGESIRNGIDGVLVPAMSSQPLADALTRLIQDSSLRQRLGDSAQERFSTEFTETAMQKNLIQILKQ